MSFDALLGNSQLKENLRMSVDSGHTSHFYLISGPVGSGKNTLARLLAAALLCRGSQKPCLHCTACRKVMADTHPDMITLRDPEHKTVAVKLVRQMRDEMFIFPNESDRKVCLFPQSLGLEGQNALLKILEEPPRYGVFILLSENPETLLPTVRSRCTHLRLQALPEQILRPALRSRFPDASDESLDSAIWRSGGFLGQAQALLQENDALPEQTEAFVRAFGEQDALALVQVLVPMEKWKRDALIPVLSQWTCLLSDALICRSGAPVSLPASRLLAARCTSARLRGALSALQRAVLYAQSNVSPAAVCGYLEWALR